MAHKYNKGEWSELYAFIYALARGEIFGADKDLERDPNTKYDILSVFQKNNTYHRDLTQGNIIFEIDDTNYKIPISEFENISESLFLEIKNGKGRTFEIPSIEPFIKNLKISSLKASSKSKGDLTFKIHDVFTNSKPILNFSVKSYIGSKPTLLNSSAATRFDFKLSKNLSDLELNEINEIKTSSKIVDRIKKIHDLNANLIYNSVSSDTFKKNLQMIDYRLPEILGRLYLESYFVKGKKIPRVVSSFIDKNKSEDNELIEYKLRQFLIACALGLVPDTSWKGLDEATGGFLVVKDNADVLCYHIYNRNNLSDYLFNHTSFDTPSTGRHAIGEVYKDVNNQQWFSLNIQIRFF